MFVLFALVIFSGRHFSDFYDSILSTHLKPTLGLYFTILYIISPTVCVTVIKCYKPE